MDEYELIGFEEHQRDCEVNMNHYCPRHGSLISNGVFDGLCGNCESEMEDSWWKENNNPENPYRKFCGAEIGIFIPYAYRNLVTCLDVEDNIPF